MRAHGPYDWQLAWFERSSHRFGDELPVLRSDRAS